MGDHSQHAGLRSAAAERRYAALQDTLQIVAFITNDGMGQGIQGGWRKRVIRCLHGICAIAEVYDSFISDQP